MQRSPTSTVGSRWSTVLSHSSDTPLRRYVRVGPLYSSHRLMMALTPRPSSSSMYAANSGALG